MYIFSLSYFHSNIIWIKKGKGLGILYFFPYIKRGKDRSLLPFPFYHLKTIILSPVRGYNRLGKHFLFPAYARDAGARIQVLLVVLPVVCAVNKKLGGKNDFNSPCSLAASIAIGIIKLEAVVVEQRVVQRWAGGRARGVCGGLAVRGREASAG